MNALQYLASHFRPKKVGEKQYIDHVPFIKRFKSQKGKSKTTIKQFVEINKLDYTITDKNGNVVDDTIDQYHYTRHKILISIDSMVSAEQLMPLIIDAHTEALNEMIANRQAETKGEDESNVAPASAPITQPNVVPASAPITQPNVVPASAPIINSNRFNLLELTDDEMFRDMNDNVVEIEVRGIRTETGILFRAKHISTYLGMENLSRVLRDTRKTYKEGIHWVKLYQYSSGIIMDSSTGYKPTASSSGVIMDLLVDQGSAASSSGVITDLLSRGSRDIDKADPSSGIVFPIEKPIWSQRYLTLAGLLKVIFCSTSANENVIILRDWVIKLVFVHKFGSATERIDLVESLTPYKKCLTKIPGIYLICIGKVNDLRKDMSISDELYPSNEYATARVYKFGRSQDIMKRFNDHCCDRTGYGKYSKTITMEWFIMIPDDLCSNAESDLNKYFETNKFKFAFNDGLKDHTELIIVKPGEQKKHIKLKYFELVKDFPTETNQIIKQMTKLKHDKDKEIADIEKDHQHELERVKAAAESKAKDHKNELLMVQSESNKNQSNLEKQLIIAQKDLEILELKLQIATK